MVLTGALITMLTACMQGQQPDQRATDDGDQAVLEEVAIDTVARRKDSLRAQARADTARMLQEAIAQFNRIEAERVAAAMNRYPDNPAMRWVLEVAPTCLGIVGALTRYVGGSVIGVEPGGLVSLPDSGSISRRRLARPTSRFAPSGPDSVDVVFGDGFTVPWIRVSLRGDGLQGRLAVTWDVGPSTDDLGAVRLERTACPAPGVDAVLPKG